MSYIVYLYACQSRNAKYIGKPIDTRVRLCISRFTDEPVIGLKPAMEFHLKKDKCK